MSLDGISIEPDQAPSHQKFDPGYIPLLAAWLECEPTPPSCSGCSRDRGFHIPRKKRSLPIQGGPNYSSLLGGCDLPYSN